MGAPQPFGWLAPAAQRIFESWGDVGRARAGLSLGLDYLLAVLAIAATARGRGAGGT